MGLGRAGPNLLERFGCLEEENSEVGGVASRGKKSDRDEPEGKMCVRME